MKKFIRKSEFSREFEAYGRGENFSYDGRDALYDYLEEVGEVTGSDVELDVIALCCEFTEYEDLAEYNESYSTEYESRDEIEEVVATVGDEGFICYEH